MDNRAFNTQLAQENKQVKVELQKRTNLAAPHLTHQRARLLLHLLNNGKDTAGSICNKCSIGNLSDTANKSTPILKEFGLAIINYTPDKPLRNTFGEETAVHYWELVLSDG